MLAFLLAVLLSVPSNPSILTIPKVEAATPDYSTTTLRDYAITVAEGNHLNTQHFLDTIQCESGFMWNALGDASTSIGIAQFRYPTSYWNISTSTAYDPYESLDIMGKAFANGEAHKWSCWRTYQKNGWPEESG